MKLALNNLSHGDTRVRAQVSVLQQSPLSIVPAIICTLGVFVPYIEGKALEHYEAELLARARELIAQMHKDIISPPTATTEPGKSWSIGIERRLAGLEEAQKPALTSETLDELYKIGRAASCAAIRNADHSLFMNDVTVRVMAQS
jgi:hypothetical protein